MNQLRAEWKVTTIGAQFEIQQGKSLSPAARRGEKPRPFLRTSNVFWGRVDLAAVDQMDFTDEEFSRLTLNDRDLLVCEGGDIGRSAVYRGPSGHYAYQNHLHRLRAKTEEVVPEFVVFWLRAGFTQLGIYEGVGNKTTIPNLSRGRLSQLPIPIPEADEQRQIAEVLNGIQRATETESAAYNKFADLKSATMAKLFREGLLREPLKHLNFGVSPESWRLAPLSDVAEVQTGVAKGRQFDNTDIVEVPYLRVANVQDGHLDLSEMKMIEIRRAELERYTLRDGDVVLTEGGDFDKLGRGFIWRSELPLCIHQNHVFAVRTDRTVLQPEFFAYLAQSPYGKAYFLQVAHKTTNLACINSNKLKAFPVVLPSLEEQEQVVRILDAIDQKLQVHKRRRVVLEDLFQSLLHQLMTGAIRVNDLNHAEVSHA